MIKTPYDWQIQQCIGSLASGVVWVVWAWVFRWLHEAMADAAPPTRLGP